jgi:hypothetical protein
MRSFPRWNYELNGKRNIVAVLKKMQLDATRTASTSCFFDADHRDFAVLRTAPRCSNRKKNKCLEVFSVKSEHPTSQRTRYDEELRTVSATRFVDEKISDDSGTEAKVADKALAPTGLKNPFWK